MESFLKLLEPESAVLWPLLCIHQRSVCFVWIVFHAYINSYFCGVTALHNLYHWLDLPEA